MIPMEKKFPFLDMEFMKREFTIPDGKMTVLPDVFIAPMGLEDMANRVIETRTIRWSGMRWHLTQFRQEAPKWDSFPIAGSSGYWPRTDEYTGEIIYNRHNRKRGLKNRA